MFELGNTHLHILNLRAGWGVGGVLVVEEEGGVVVTTFTHAENANTQLREEGTTYSHDGPETRAERLAFVFVFHPPPTIHPTPSPLHLFFKVTP